MLVSVHTTLQLGQEASVQKLGAVTKIWCGVCVEGILAVLQAQKRAVFCSQTSRGE